MAANSEKDRDFFAPLWRRLVLFAIVAAWFAYEAIVTRDTTWMLISGGMLAYAIWNYAIRWKRPTAS